MRSAAWGAIVATLMTGVAHGGEPGRGDVLFYATALGVTNGYSDRYAVGTLGNFYFSSGWGAHFDAVGNWREEDAAYVAGGLSYAVTPQVRPKMIVGTSSYNLGILPQFAIQGSVNINVAPFIIEPALTYREYRNGVKQTSPEIQLAYYLPAFSDQSYLVAQTSAVINFVSPGNHTGYEVGGGLTYVIPKLGSAALSVFGGTMAYDNTLCTGPCSVRNKFIGVRPKLGTYVNEKTEAYVAGEIVRTDYYDVYGATLGVKIGF